MRGRKPENPEKTPDVSAGTTYPAHIQPENTKERVCPDRVPNPGRSGERRERYRSATLPPLIVADNAI